MTEFSTKDAGDLAQGICQIKNQRLVGAFLGQRYFKQAEKSSSSPHRHLKAEVGRAGAGPYRFQSLLSASAL